jgi:hypothetical protein
MSATGASAAAAASGACVVVTTSGSPGGILEHALSRIEREPVGDDDEPRHGRETPSESVGLTRAVPPGGP